MVEDCSNETQEGAGRTPVQGNCSHDLQIFLIGLGGVGVTMVLVVSGHDTGNQHGIRTMYYYY